MLDRNHPRYESLLCREKIVEAYKDGILADSGMIAHGRGETFDYLIGEKTTENTRNTIEVAACLFLLSENPVLSVNGNTTALVAGEVAQLSKILDAPVEINLYYRTDKRVKNIERVYRDLGVEKILGTGKDEFINTPALTGPRSPVSIKGINKADVVFIPLEDGDRAEKLTQNNHKKTINIDLNPLSRTAQTSTITIVDNITRAMPELISAAEKYQNKKREKLEEKVSDFNNQKNLKNCIDDIIKRFK